MVGWREGGAEGMDKGEGSSPLVVVGARLVVVVLIVRPRCLSLSFTLSVLMTRCWWWVAPVACERS